MQPLFHAGIYRNALQAGVSLAEPGARRNRRLLRCSLLALLLLCGPACALTVDGRSRVHAVIGQPLSVILPLNFSGAPTHGVDVQVAPAPGLPDAEEEVAESVRASYDPVHSTIRLTTVKRVVVPAIRLRLVISTDSLVVNHEFDVLVDLPDFNKQFDRRETAAAAEGQSPEDADGVGTPTLDIHGEGKQVARFGDTAIGDAAGAAVSARPAATAALAPRPAPRRPGTYAVHRGDTLSAIATRLAKTYSVPAAPLTLALYEANPQAFPVTAPEHPIAGKQLLVPDPVVVSSEPPDRVAAFKKYLRHPLGQWKLPSFVSFGEASLDPATAKNAGARQEFFRAMLTAAAATALFLLTSALARRLGPRLKLRRLLPRRRSPADGPPPLTPDAFPDPDVEQEIKHLRRMLTERPWRSDLRFQLAQRLFKARDAKGFGEIAPALKPALNEESWQRVRAMGQELLPSDPRFQD